MNKEELDEILEKHEKWFNCEDGVECANLTDANLTGANLIGANLAHANLRYADLAYANLIGANFRYANLTGADLTGANLMGANLIGANLIDAKLIETDLTDANLTVADLIDTNLAHADLTDANLTGADIQNTIFSNVIGKTIISIQLNTSVENRVINYIPEIDIVSAGCFHGTLEELKTRVQEVYSYDEKIRKRYEKAIELIEFLKEGEAND